VVDRDGTNNLCNPRVYYITRRIYGRINGNRTLGSSRECNAAGKTGATARITVGGDVGAQPLMLRMPSTAMTSTNRKFIRKGAPMS